MNDAIKKHIKKNCVDKIYTQEKFEEIAVTIAEKLDNEYSTKKVKNTLSQYAEVVDGGIKLYKKQHNNDMKFKKLIKLLSKSEHKEKDKKKEKKKEKKKDKKKDKKKGKKKDKKKDKNRDTSSDISDNEIKPIEETNKKFNVFNKKNKGRKLVIDKTADEEFNTDVSEFLTNEIIEKKPYYKILYPSYNGYKYKRNSDPDRGPYGSQWVHDKQKDDELTERELKLREQFDFISKIEYPEQRTEAWFEARRSKITASDGGTAQNVNPYETQWKFVVKKLVEPPFKPGEACYHGTKLEEPATMVYEYRRNAKVTEFGMCPHATIDFLGASPDGIVSPYKLDQKHLTNLVGRMLEIKCPFKRKINKTGPITGPSHNVQCPIYYWYQVQQQLECCDLDECDFWQCEIDEYKSRAEFIDDTDLDNPFLSKLTKMEKGCVIQLQPNEMPEDKKDTTKDERVWGLSKFIYPTNIEMSPQDVDIWIAKTCERLHITHPEYHLDRILYWKMIKTHNVTIKRDKKWFKEHYNIYKMMWDYVTYFRNNKDDQELLLNYIRSLPNMNKVEYDQRNPRPYFAQKKINASLSKERNIYIMQLYKDICKGSGKKYNTRIEELKRIKHVEGDVILDDK